MKHDTAISVKKQPCRGAEENVGKFTGLVLAADDIQSTYETLRDRGVHFTEPPTAQAWGMKQALLEDQDGNGFVLVGQ